MLQTQPRRTPFLARQSCKPLQATISRICTPCPARPPNRERQQQECTDTVASRQVTSGKQAFISKVGRASKLSIKCEETKMSRPRGPAHQLAAHPLLHKIRNLATSGFPAPDADHQKHVSSFGETLDMARLYIAMWMQLAAEKVRENTPGQ